MPGGSRASVAVWVGVILLASVTRVSAESVRIVVWKQRRVLEVVNTNQVIRRYAISLGISPVGRKEVRGDGKTPVGRYYIYQKRPSDRFRWFLALNYPDSEDADRAFDAGRISADTWADIWIADRTGHTPPWDTPLGAFVGIHGTGANGRKAKLRLASDWTDGCIAVSDRDIDDLYALVEVGTPVEIHE
ncbi:MAG TPA: L,D-transpeptidase [Candidatus Binatia bacterium]|nr:L,D-transpeptidase [Candidatus Binatia bacterium]